MSKQPPPAPTASAIGPCPTVIEIVGRPGTGSLPSTIEKGSKKKSVPRALDKREREYLMIIMDNFNNSE